MAYIPRLENLSARRTINNSQWSNRAKPKDLNQDLMNICDYSTTQKATRKTKHIIQNSKMISQRIFHAHRGSLESKIKKLKKMQLKTGFYIPNKFNPGIKLKVFNPLRIHKSTSEPQIEDESLSPAMPVNKSIKIALKQKYLLFQAPGSK